GGPATFRSRSRGWPMSAEPLRIHQPTEDGDVQTPPPPVEPTKRLIRLPDLFDRLAVSAATGHRLRAAGKVGPRAIRLGKGCVRFDLEEVLAWLGNRRTDGTLHDSKTWPAVWEAIGRKK